MSDRDRLVYCDYLRVLATFAVIILHLAAQKWYSEDVNGFEWQTLNFFHACVRWGVPTFVMISGALFLNKRVPLGVIYKKYVLRMVTALFSWSFIYALFEVIDGVEMKEAVKSFFRGHYHMWFIWMIIGIYMCLPFIYEIINKRTLMTYFMVLAFVFAILFPQMITLGADLGSDGIVAATSVLKQNISDMNLNMVLGYVFYFILGYYLNETELSKKQRTVIYILGIVGFVLTIVLDAAVAIKTQKYCGDFYGAFNVNILLECVAMFTFFKYMRFNFAGLNRWMAVLSKYSFGVYLVHTLILERFNKMGMQKIPMRQIFIVPIAGVVICIISYAISAICNHIPMLKKYIV